MTEGNGSGTGMTVKEMLADHRAKLESLDQRLDRLTLALYLAIGLGIVDIVAPYLEPISQAAAAIAR